MSGRLKMNAGFHELEVGDSMTTRGRTITESDLVGFAALTGDWHPQHADAEWATGSPFGERIAHGMMVVSYAVGLVPFDPDRVIALRGLERVTFKRPTRLGDTVRVEAKVTEKRPLDDDHGLVYLKWRILNQDRKAVVVLEVAALWRIDRDDGGPATDRGAGTARAAGASSGRGDSGAGAADDASDRAGPERAVFL